MWLIAGLGNPGKKYERNRHNVGFRVVDELVRRHSLGPLRDKIGGLGWVGAIGTARVAVVKPMKYMNHSGFAVSQAAQFHGVLPEELVVVHDEIDLPFARLRLKAGGGHGGHNGLRSIVEQLGHSDFLRVRIGVGRPPGGPREEGAERPDQGAGAGQVSSYVLADFPAEMDRDVAALVERATDATEAILARGIRAAMNQFNGEIEEKTADP
jgi:PTH1 family peptidyl-tRNA hydrolase